MIPNVGATEMIVFLVVVLLLFGAKRIPEVARGLGSGLGELRKGASVGDGGAQGGRDRELP